MSAPDGPAAESGVRLLAVLTPAPGGIAALSTTVAWLKTGMERRGMTMLGAFQTLPGGEPERIVDLWSVPDANTVVDALAGARAHPTHEAAIGRLAEVLHREVLRLVIPAAHCPRFPAAATPGGRYVLRSLTAHYGRGPALCRELAVVGAALEEHEGWRLAAAYETVVGDLSEVFELWQLPDDQDPTATLARVVQRPELQPVAATIATLLERQDLLHLTPTEFCP